MSCTGWLQLLSGQVRLANGVAQAAAVGVGPAVSVPAELVGEPHAVLALSPGRLPLDPRREVGLLPRVPPDPRPLVALVRPVQPVELVVAR